LVVSGISYTVTPPTTISPWRDWNGTTYVIGDFDSFYQVPPTLGTTYIDFDIGFEYANSHANLDYSTINFSASIMCLR